MSKVFTYLRCLEKTFIKTLLPISLSNKLSSLLKQFKIFSYIHSIQTQSRLRWQRIAGNTEVRPVLPADLTTRKLINYAADTHSFRCLLIQLATKPGLCGKACGAQWHLISLFHVFAPLPLQKNHIKQLH